MCVLRGNKFTYYDGLTNVDKFLDAFEREVPKDHHFWALDLALRNTPARWWGTHKDSFDGWRDYRRMMRLWFGHPSTRLTEKYDGRDDPHDHLAKWTKYYGTELQPEWVHLFYHTLDVIPRNWYTKIELRHGTSEWDILREGFLLTFTFEDLWWDTVDDVLQAVKTTIFKIP